MIYFPGFRFAAIGVLGVVSTGCVHVSKSVLMDRSAFPVPVEQVNVFLPGDEVPDTCERVAILHASGSQDFSNESDMLNRLREETGDLGGNAVQIRSMEDADTGERVVSALFGTGSDRDSEAIALHCPDQGEPE